jgi:hypothetical protein
MVVVRATGNVRSVSGGLPSLPASTCAVKKFVADI